jgi:hypothetical protein
MAKKIASKSKVKKSKTKKVSRSTAPKVHAFVEKMPKRAGGGAEKQAYDASITRRVLYVDYDTINVDPNNGDIIYGYWATLPSLACDKSVYNYVRRIDLTGYEYYGPCRDSVDGIWKFTLAE